MQVSKMACIFFLSRAQGSLGIAGCVTHLYVRNSNELSTASEEKFIYSSITGTPAATHHYTPGNNDSTNLSFFQ